MKIGFVKINKNAIIPYKASEEAIGYDLAIPEDVVIKPGRQIIPLGWALALPHLYEGKIEPRSGNSSKGMTGRCTDGTEDQFDADVILGKIDPDYRGVVGVIINSHDPRTFIIPARTRIAQFTIYKTEDVQFEEVTTLDNTERGNGGFGYTGI